MRQYLSEETKRKMRERAVIYREKQKEYKDFKPKGDPVQLQKLRELAEIKRMLRDATTPEQIEATELMKKQREDRMKSERVYKPKSTKKYSYEKTEEQKEAIMAKDRARYVVKVRVKKGATVKLAIPKPLKKDKAPKPIIKRLVKREVDLSKMIALRLDHRTVVYIRPDQDPEEVRQRYSNRSSF